jgi:hypothetical protein
VAPRWRVRLSAMPPTFALFPGPRSLIVSCGNYLRGRALRGRPTEGEPNPNPYPHGEASVALLSAP